ncbi:MAG TPA: citrate/2-methylcitrate synthase [Syntrophales bacterium]|nr:citrate/2-methylcitrate synthase [Syntrophales bacterium]
MGTIGNLDDPRLNYDYSKRERGTVPQDKTRAPFQWVSAVAYKNVHRIVTRGYDTTELVEAGYGLPDIIFIDFQARIPLIEETQMLNYVMVLSLDDGLSSPAAIARITGSSTTLLTQACGASILAFGHTYGAFDSFGKMLDKYLAMVENEGKPTGEVAELLARENLDAVHLGVSDMMLKDPAAKRTFARAEKLGVAGKYIAFMKEVVAAVQKISDKPVDLDLLGAIGATMMDLGFSSDATWVIVAITRAFAAGAHWCEEVEREPQQRFGEALTPQEDYDGPDDRPVPTLEERKRFASAVEYKTPEEWKKGFVEKQKMYGTGWRIVEDIVDPRDFLKKQGRK